MDTIRSPGDGPLMLFRRTCDRVLVHREGARIREKGPLTTLRRLLIKGPSGSALYLSFCIYVCSILNTCDKYMRYFTVQ
jgi:hypothetical protein